MERSIVRRRPVSGDKEVLHDDHRASRGNGDDRFTAGSGRAAQTFMKALGDASGTGIIALFECALGSHAGLISINGYPSGRKV
jgi:hypothetical protein